MKLNPKLFELQPNTNNIYKLRSDIREALLNIASAFCDFLRDNGIEITPADIQLVGSNAGEDYTDKSDIDLHIVTDFEQLGCNNGIVQAAFNAQRALFNSSYDITVKGIPVELYVEDVKAGTESVGIYSIMFDRWIKYPEVQEPIPEDVKSQYDILVDQWKSIINNAVKSENLSEIQRVINRLYMIRKNGLATAGRNSGGNYIFKQLRNEGYLQQLKDLRDELISQKLTLESLLHKVCEAYPAENPKENSANNTMKYVITANIIVDKDKLNSAKSSLDAAAVTYSNLHPETAVTIKNVSYDSMTVEITVTNKELDNASARNIISDIVLNSKYTNIIK